MVSQKPLMLTIKDTQALHAAYMPLLERGGIFVSTCGCYALGERVELQLTLPDANQGLQVTGEVVWISPEGVAGQRVPGIGIHFSPADQRLREHIETLLAGRLDEGAPGYTL